MMGVVLSDGQQSAPFGFLSGGKQGCILAPVHCNFLFAQVLEHLKMGLNRGIYICYYVDDSISDLRHITANTKTFMEFVTEALFADDCASWLIHKNYLQVILDSCLLLLSYSDKLSVLGRKPLSESL